MAKLLFCWELGANFGHLSSIAKLQSQLAVDGFEIVFAVTDLKAARELLGPDATILQAPVWPRHIHRGSTLALSSFADVLALVGYGQQRNLAAVVDGWLDLITLIDPAVLVVDHSPAAQLAALIAQRRLVTIGTPFTMPPLGYPAFPLLRANLALAVPEAELLASARAVVSRHSARLLPETLPSLFAAHARVVIGLPELDPYRSFRREPLYAPVGGYAVPAPISETRLFAYLGSELPGLASKLQVLCDLPCPVEIYVRDGDSLLTEFIRLRGKIAHTNPVSSNDLMERVSHVISQGGAMTASEALAAGRPNFVMPLHQEAKLNATMIVNGGLGQEFDPSDDKLDRFAKALEGFLTDREIRNRTLDLARVLATRTLPDAGAALRRVLQEVTQTGVSSPLAPSAAPRS